MDTNKFRLTEQSIINNFLCGIRRIQSNSRFSSKVFNLIYNFVNYIKNILLKIKFFDFQHLNTCFIGIGFAVQLEPLVSFHANTRNHIQPHIQYKHPAVPHSVSSGTRQALSVLEFDQILDAKFSPLSYYLMLVV